MRLSHRSAGAPRAGVILLVVVLMLALFLVVGLSFVLYAESAATGSRINREAQSPDVVDVLPETLLSWALGQMIYPVPDDSNGALSAMRGHELARSMFGWNYFDASAGTPNPTLTNVLPSDATQRNTVPYSQANIIPFNGEGPLRSLPAPPAVAARNITDYDLVNYTWFKFADSPQFVRDPERAATRQDPSQSINANQFAGGFNAPYTYPDRTNMCLAAVEANGGQPMLLMPSFVRPTTNLPFVNPKDPNAAQLDPTTPGGQTFWNSPSVLAGGNAASWWKYATLRPRPGEQLFQGETLGFDAANNAWIATNSTNGTIRRAFPPPADVGGDVKQLPGVPFVYKNANGQLMTAQNDSFWMDLNYPVQISRNGKKFKPLFAFLVLDLDGRINLNIHGNVNATIVQNQNPTTILNQHASNQGLSRTEVNVGRILTVPNPATNMPEWSQLFIGSAVSPLTIPRYGPDKTPGYVSLGANNAILDPYAADPILGQPARSLIFPVDADAIDLNNNRQVTTKFALPLNMNYAGATDTVSGFRSFPEFGLPTQPILTGYDNYYFDPTKPPSNPRLNHPLLSQKLRAFGDDQPYGDDNMYYLLAGDYRKSSLYSVIPYNLGYDGSNASYTTLGNKNRQQITTRSYDVDAPGASPWVTTSAQSAYQYTQLVPTVPANVINTQNYPKGTSMPTPTPAQMNSLAAQAATRNDYSDFKTNDGRANLLSRVDLNRKLTSYYDANGLFVQPMDKGAPIPPPDPSILASTFPLATNPQYRYFYATYDRQQLARDIFVRLVHATGAMMPDTAGVGTAPNFVIAPKIGSLHAASGASQANYIATRWLAQLAVNIVDYIDDDDTITPFQWNPAPDAALAADAATGSIDSGWVYGVEAPKLVINEAYCEAANDPNDKTASLSGAKLPYQYNFWLELYNPMPSATPGTAISATNLPPANRQDPNKVSQAAAGSQDRMAVQLQRASAALGKNYPIYKIQIVNELENPTLSLTQPGNTDGSIVSQQAVKIEVNGYNPDSSGDTQRPTTFVRPYPDPTYVQPTMGSFLLPSIGGANNPPSNTGFYVLAPDFKHPFIQPQAGGAGQAGGPTLQPTMYLLTQSVPPQTLQFPWGWPQTAGGPQAPVSGLTYAATSGPGWTSPSRTPNLDEVARTHTVLLRRLACPDLDPNPLVKNPSGAMTPLDPSKPMNPYITVDYITGVPTNDAVQYTSAPTTPGTKNPDPPAQTPSLRSSIGRVQPYAASVTKAQQSNAPNPVKNTFFQHNSPTPPSVGMSAVNSPLDWPFDWLVFLDRPLTNVMEVLNVPSTYPHMLTQAFAIGQYQNNNPKNGLTSEQRLQHLAPWTVSDARIYRALEFFTVGDRSPYPGTGGRLAGKINVNTIFDRDPLDAATDPQQSNFFLEHYGATPQTGAVTDVWQGTTNVNNVATLADPKNLSFLSRKQRLLNLSAAATSSSAATGLPDRPFLSLAAPFVKAADNDQQYPATQFATGVSIVDTILSGMDPDPNTATNKGVIGTFYPIENTAANPPTWPTLNYTPPAAGGQPPTIPPYILNELLTKTSGHVTNRSNTFAVFVTVGFFEVLDDPPGQTPSLPVKLGAEITSTGGKPVRHQMFSIVDRTNLAIDAGVAIDPTINDPTGRLRQAPTPPIFMSVVESVAPGAASATLTIAGGLPNDYDGTSPVVFQIGQTLFLEMGANVEPVRVQSVNTALNQITVTFPYNTPKQASVGHPASSMLCNYLPGNPGPQGPIDYASPQYRAVVPFTYIIQ